VPAPSTRTGNSLENYKATMAGRNAKRCGVQGNGGLVSG
jgi:hypothetical protein